MTTKKGILFLNMGGPENLDEVKPFLRNMFRDPEIIKVSWKPLRYFIAWMISTAREKKSQSLYKLIGGGSPIRKYTEAQANLVEMQLKDSGHDVMVRTAFVYSPPMVEDAIDEMVKEGVDTFLSLPLFPQYSYTTTRGSFTRVREALKKKAPQAKYSEIRSWETFPDFIRAHVSIINEELKKFDEMDKEKITLLFSAHSIPEKLVTKEGDPYKGQVEDTVAAVIKALNWKGAHVLGWQSRLGPIKWIGPSTPEVIEQLAHEGKTKILIIPIAFVSDHIETLCEIDIEFAEEAKAAGIKEFRKTPGLNTHPDFIKALTSLCIRCLSNE